MSVPLPKFWQLLVESRLVSDADCQNLHEQFSSLRGAANQGNSRALAEWLVAQNALSRFQVTVLLAGRSGPFFYGDFKVCDRVQGGRFTGMFQAEHVPTGHPVLLQFLTGPLSNDGQAWSDAVIRIREYALLNHPNLLRCHDAIEVGAFRFVVWQCPVGQSLSYRWATSTRMQPSEACRLGSSIAEGLAALHQAGKVAGEVSPPSLWLDVDGRGRLFFDPLHLPKSTIDAGADELAEQADYWAPELLESGRDPDPLTDIYALGCTLYHVLSGQPPFPGGNARQKLARHAAEPIQPLEPLGVPAPVAQKVAYMMAKNRETRYSQASEVADALAPHANSPTNLPPAASAPDTLQAFQQHLAQSSVSPHPSEAVTKFPGISPKVASYTHRLRPRSESSPPAPSDAPVAPSVTTSTFSPSLADGKHRHGTCRSRIRQTWIAIGAAAAVVLAIALIVALNIYRDPDRTGVDRGNVADTGPSAPAGSANPQQSKPPSPEQDPDPPLSSPEIVEDDGSLLWASPTSGPPIDFQYMPPEAQLYLFMRPTEMLATEEGRRVLRALGPELTTRRQQWEATTGIQLDQVEQLILALHPAGGVMPRASLVIYLPADTIDQLQMKWGAAETAGKDFGKVYGVGGWTVLVPGSASPPLVVLGSPQDMNAVVAARGAAPLIRREMKGLLQVSDSDRHLTLLVAPNFLFADGRELFSGTRQKILEPLGTFIGDGLQGLLCSFHFSDDFYGELRAAAIVETPPSKLAEQFQQRLKDLPDHVFNYMAQLNTPPYWRKLAMRFPQMVEQLRDQTRVGMDADHAVLNFSLHPSAAHNLTLGVELAMASTPDDNLSVVTTPSGNQRMTMHQLLSSWKTSFSVDQQSLDFTMRDLAQHVNSSHQLAKEFRIKIIGPDLQLDGITRNQQIRGFDVQDSTLSRILTQLVVKANPNQVEDPSDPGQKLVWVLAPNPDGADPDEIVLITTRRAAEANDYQLAEPFVGQRNENKK